MWSHVCAHEIHRKNYSQHYLYLAAMDSKVKLPYACNIQKACDLWLASVEKQYTKYQIFSLRAMDPYFHVVVISKVIKVD